MLEMFKEIEWSDYVEILTYNSPPVYVQILVFSSLCLAYYLYHIFSGKRRVSKGNKIKYKIMFFGVILLILFQEKYDLRGWFDLIRS